MMFLALQRVQHLLHQIVDVEQFKLSRAIINSDGQVVGDVVAEGRHGAVVVGTAPLAEQIRETIDHHPRAGILCILEEQLFASQLGLAVIRLSVTSDQRGLNGGRKHHRAGVSVLLQRIQQRRSKAEVARHELTVLLGTVHTRQIEHEIRLRAIFIQQRRISVNVVFKNRINNNIRAGTILAFHDVAQIADKILAHKALCAGDEDFHFFAASSALRT